MRQQYSPAIEKRLECIKEGCHTESTQKKRKISRFIFIFDILLIIVIFFYFYNTREESTVSSGSVTQNGIVYRFSSSVHENSYIFMASVSGTKSLEQIEFTGYIADLMLYYKGNRIIHRKVEGKSSMVSVSKDSVENFFITVPFDEINSSLAEYRSDEEKDAFYDLLFGNESELDARLRFNTGSAVTVETKLPYKNR